MNKIVLASTSPRRKVLLEQIGIKFDIETADTDENLDGSYSPAEYVEALSYRKAEAVAKKRPDDIVLGADTIVVFEDIILGKPRDEDDAYRMLSMLAGKIHEVYTGVTILSPGDGIRQRDTFHVKTGVVMYDNDPDLIKDYIESREPMDKAGAYGIQGRGAVLVKEIRGDYYNVMGLPIAEVFRYLKKRSNLYTLF